VDKNRLWIICSVLVMALVVAGGWFLGVQPQLGAFADAEAQTASVQQTNEKYAQTLAKLKKDSENLPALKAKLASLAASVPEGSDIPAFIDQLNALYTASNVSTRPSPTLSHTLPSPRRPPRRRRPRQHRRQVRRPRRRRRPPRRKPGCRRS